MKLITFALIPLILSIGISPAIPFSAGVEYSQICIDKVWIEKTTGKIACVTPSTAEKLVERGWGTLLSDDAFNEDQSETTPFELPPYPDQPSIHPKLLATNDFWYPPAVHKVTDGVYSAVGYDLANSIMIEGDDGIIIIDTLSTYEKAKEVITEFRKITDKPVKAIIYTHGHMDHVHGTGAFLEEGEDIEIYAHDSHLDFYINENSVLGPIASMRSAHVAGAFLPQEGPDRANNGLFPTAVPGTISYVAPTQTFSDELEIEISGVKMKMVFVAGESSDQIFIWLPDKDVLLIGDNIYAEIPNIYTLRGAVYRDPMNYVNALDKMIPLEAEYMVGSHLKPVAGKEIIRDILVSTRDATQYLHDQTIRGMNQGYTADELSRMIQLPEHLDNHPWLTKARNDVSAHVKQIYYGNLGWFEGNSAFLNAISLEERSHKIVDGFGGVQNSILSIRDAIDNEEYEWAAELGAYVLNVEPDNLQAKLLQAYTLRVLSYNSEGMDERHWLLTDALKLEGKITLYPGAFTQSSPEQMAELPIEKIIKFLPTKLDPEKAAGIDTVLGVTYSDIDMSFTLHVRNSILAVTDGAPESPDMTLVLDSDTHKLIVGGHLEILDAIESGQVELTGNVDNLVDFLNLFDNFSLRTNEI
ncbi:MAG: MBL fold metallo-hydrolase [Thaumarchaeota archaeon]|nr:MBL fold metallo-hydrolase [Nitrososphaerota archaeon]